MRIKMQVINELDEVLVSLDEPIVEMSTADDDITFASTAIKRRLDKYRRMKEIENEPDNF